MASRPLLVYSRQPRNAPPIRLVAVNHVSLGHAEPYEYMLFDIRVLASLAVALFALVRVAVVVAGTALGGGVHLHLAAVEGDAAADAGRAVGMGRRNQNPDGNWFATSTIMDW